jgi:homoserine kinase
VSAAAPPLAARVRVPASTSNLGAGFDCVGVAVARWLDAAVRVSPARVSPARVPEARLSAARAGDAAPAVTVARGGTLAAVAGVAPHDDHLWRGFVAACARAGAPLPARVAFDARSDIPVARGLGSSAAALVAGAALAAAALALPLAPADVAAVAAELEGHGDNAGPCALGGAVLAAHVRAPGGGARFVFRPLALHADVALVFAVPAFALETRAARAALPAALPHATAVGAASRAAALVQGLATGDAALLAHALDDVLHVPYRRALVPGLDAVVAAAVAAGAHGATLSGAGSSLVALAPRAAAARVAAAMAGAWGAAGVDAEAFVADGADGLRAG